MVKVRQDNVEEVNDIVPNPPETNERGLKNYLLTIFEEAETGQVQKVLKEHELGDQKKSQLLCKMKMVAVEKLADGSPNCDCHRP